MNLNHGYLDEASLTTNGNNKRRWNDGEEAGTAHGASGDENSNTATGNQFPMQAFKRLRVTHEDEDGDLFMSSPSRLFPPALHHSPLPPQHQQPLHDSLKHQTAGQETSSEHVTTTPMARNHVQAAPDTDYHNVNHVLGQLHQQRMEREQRQAALQNQYHPDSAHHSTNAMSPAASRAGSESASGSFHTPPTRRRKVVHLHTDSKLR
jgi:hypothetical protein